MRFSTRISTNAAWTSLAMPTPSPQTIMYAPLAISLATSSICSRNLCWTYTFSDVSRLKAHTNFESVPSATKPSQSESYKKSSSRLRQPKNNMASPSVTPSFAASRLDWRNPRKGATPVPGPIMMSGADASSGKPNFKLGLMYTGTGAGVAVSASNQFVATPSCSSPPAIWYLTTLNATDGVVGATSGAHVIEYSLGANGGSASRSSAKGGLQLGKRFNNVINDADSPRICVS
mmetsp:Transcript_3257/g.7039  ORF Transcript_3257/g.7039 Transcript_3257/m.7039 type:complete len:233 (+) Transcript_3257:155-853(+)